MKTRCSPNVLALLFVSVTAACGQEGSSHKAADVIKQLTPVEAIESAPSPKRLCQSSRLM